MMTGLPATRRRSVPGRRASTALDRRPAGHGSHEHARRCDLLGGIKAATGQRSRQVASGRRAQAAVRARAGVVDHVRLSVQMNDCAACRSLRKASARSRGFIKWDVGMLRDGERGRRFIDWMQALWPRRRGPARRRPVRRRSTTRQQHHGLLPAEARVPSARLREGDAPARGATGRGADGGLPIRPRRTRISRVPASPRCSQRLKMLSWKPTWWSEPARGRPDGAQGLPLWFVEAHHHHVRGWRHKQCRLRVHVAGQDRARVASAGGGRDGSAAGFGQADARSFSRRSGAGALTTRHDRVSLAGQHQYGAYRASRR